MDGDRLLAAHREAAAFYRAGLLRAAGPRRYLTERGLGVVVAQEEPWCVGYAPPGWTTLTDHLRALGFSTAETVAAGLSRVTTRDRIVDHFRDRVMFPLRDAPGRVVGFIGRAAPGAPTRTPKYLNSPDTTLYHKGKVLLGLVEQADRLAAGWPPVLVEGPADAIAVWLAHRRVRRPGLVGVATCGALLTRDQADLLTHRSGGVLVAFDGDEGGRLAADRAFHLLFGRTGGAPVHGVELPPDLDPAAYVARPGGAVALRRVLTARARPLSDVVADHRLERLLRRHPDLLSHVEGRIAAARALAPLIADLGAADAVRLVRHVAARTGAGVDTVAACVTEVLEADPPARLGRRRAAG